MVMVRFMVKVRVRFKGRVMFSLKVRVRVKD